MYKKNLFSNFSWGKFLSADIRPSNDKSCIYKLYIEYLKGERLQIILWSMFKSIIKSIEWLEEK